jgi:transposase
MRLTLESLVKGNLSWLRTVALPHWAEFYSTPCFNFRIPKSDREKAEWLARVGRDGYYLLEQIDRSENEQLQSHPKVMTLRKIWEQHFAEDSGKPGRRPRLRNKDEHTIRSSEMIVSPHDPDARLGTKRGVQHKGFKTHITESCEDDSPHLIVHVETTDATRTDVEMRPVIEQRLEQKGLYPEQHFVDAGYTDVESIKDARDKGLDVIGPLQFGTSWQQKARQGFALEDFKIDWEKQAVTCPAGKSTNNWSERKRESSIHVKFDLKDCSDCPLRANCTKGKEGRTLQFKYRDLFELLDALRRRQQTAEFKKLYCKRNGIEGTLSQAVRRSGARRSRYLGLAKTNLQVVATAVAVNVVRLGSWLIGHSLAKTRLSPMLALAPSA